MRYRLLLLLLAALSARAQSPLVHPLSYDLLEGEQNQNWPFYMHATTPSYRQVVYQQVHDNLSPSTLPIRGIAFRRDPYRHEPWTAWTADLELTLATAPPGISATTLSSTFANNLGLDAAVVIAQTKVSFPTSFFVDRMPQPFLIRLPFDSGRVFPLLGGKSLCWQVKVSDNDLHATLGASPALDKAYWSSTATSFGGAAMDFGQGGFAPRQYRAMAASMSSALNKKGTPPAIAVNGNLADGPRAGKCLALLAGQRFQQGIPIGLGGGSLWLLPSSILLVSSVLNLDYQGDYGGNASSVANVSSIFSLPDDPNLYGLHIFGQFVAFDSGLAGPYLPNATALQLARDPGAAGAPLVGYTYTYNNLTNPTGNGPYSNQGLVVEFTR